MLGELELRKPGGYSATHTNVPPRFSNVPRPGNGKWNEWMR